MLEGNNASMAAFPEILPRKETTTLAARLLALQARLSPLIDERARAGRVRHGHGDLHLANIAMIDGEPVLFDCLEFSPALATVDVLYDLAFLLMDLWQRGCRFGANIVFNRYLDLSPEDEAGVALLPLFLSVRAVIRSHVLATQSARGGGNPNLASRARDYLQLARDFLEPCPPRLVAVGGLSGTGKSTLARSLGHGIGRPPGARILRSDVLRKRIAGVAPETPLPSHSYSSAANVEVYRLIRSLAAEDLAQGCAVVADAVYADPAERAAIQQVADVAGLPFAGLWMVASEMTRTRRIVERPPDASDADAALVHLQAARNVGSLGMWRTLSADGSLEETAVAARAMLGVP
jgi:predicted kinase